MKIISTRPCLCLRTNLEPRIPFWGLIWAIFWFLFWVPFVGAVLGPWTLFVLVGTQYGAQKWTRDKNQNMTQIRLQIAIRPQICTETQTRTCRDDLHSAVGLLGDLIQLCNKPAASTKEGKLGRTKLLKQRAWIHSQTKHSQDMFYLQKIHSQVSRMGKSTACLLLWGYVHASPQNCSF